MNNAAFSPILDTGGPPPQKHLLERIQNLSGEELLLFAAWAHGMAAEDIVHRYTLFAFVQTHLIRKSEEQMQAIVEKSPNWEGKGKGKYKLTQRGLNHILNNFGPTPPRSSLTARYVLSRASNGHIFAVEVQPNSHKLSVSVDGAPMKGEEACRQLGNLRETFNTVSNSGNTRVWNWIVQEGNFNWKRLA